LLVVANSSAARAAPRLPVNGQILLTTYPAVLHAAVCVLQLVVFVVGPGSVMADAEALVHAFEHLSSLHAAGEPAPTTQQTAAAAVVDSSSANSSSSHASKDSIQTAHEQQPHSQQQQQCAAMSPRNAFFADTQVTPIAAAAGRISAELLCPYPPGVPLVFPGEPLSSGVLRQLQATLAAGGVVTGARDATLQTVLVVAD
jgi:arginine/lysine/ornithine decarboxylase